MNPNNNTPQEQMPLKTPLEDLRNSALGRYNELAGQACYWSGFVEAAIKAYVPPDYVTPEQMVYNWKSIDRLVRRYKTYCDNLKYHLEVNKPEKDVERCTTALECYSEISKDLSTLKPVPLSSLLPQPEPQGEDWRAAFIAWKDVYWTKYGTPPDPQEVTDWFSAIIAQLQAELKILREQRNEALDQSEAYEKEIKGLRNWKESAIAAMPDYQALSKLCGFKLGTSVPEQLIPYIESLQGEIKRLNEQLKNKESNET